MVRGKEGKSVEFGPKAHMALVDGYAFLDHALYESFHEGVQLKKCLDRHQNRFDKQPKLILEDQLYANRKNRRLLEEKNSEHSFKRIGRPPNETTEEKQKHRRDFKKKQGERNHVEATFGHLKSRFNLEKIKWKVPGGETMQIKLGLIAFNLHSAVANT